MSLTISIGVHGRFHAFDLATALNDLATVSQVATTYPGIVARRFLPRDIPVKSAPLLEIRRRIYDRYRLGRPPDGKIARSFGAFAARTLPRDFDVFVGWSSASLEALERVKSLGNLAVVERGSTHILHQRDVLSRIYDAHGRTFRSIDPLVIDRELAEYAAADLIAVPTRFAADTFMARGVPESRLLVNPYGVDAELYRCALRTGHSKPVVLFVGGVGFRKGAPELLDAHRQIGDLAELHLVGPIEAGWRPDPGNGVVFAGPLDRTGLVDAMQRADIFCLPSHEEGLSLSLLQAMAAGLPVVATPESGAEEVVTSGVNGLIVHAGNVEQLAGALAELAEDRERRLWMGENARRTAAGQCWSAYGARALAGYTRQLQRIRAERAN